MHKFGHTASYPFFTVVSPGFFNAICTSLDIEYLPFFIVVSQDFSLQSSFLSALNCRTIFETILCYDIGYAKTRQAFGVSPLTKVALDGQQKYLF